uniref:Putative secreted protein n=1 Tax=Ixodes ricinus TaxID=34613 RepID=A0A6B0UI64_IXORI
MARLTTTSGLWTMTLGVHVTAWGTWPTRTWMGFLLITWTTCIRFPCEDALQTTTSTCHRPSSREVCHQIRGIHLHLAGTDQPLIKVAAIITFFFVLFTSLTETLTLK